MSRACEGFTMIFFSFFFASKHLIFQVIFRGKRQYNNNKTNIKIYYEKTKKKKKECQEMVFVIKAVKAVTTFTEIDDEIGIE